MRHHLPCRSPNLASYREKYPKFQQVEDIYLRPNTVLILPYSPKGFSKEGLYVETNERWARVWGFVLKCSPDNTLSLAPGDIVLFERWCERYLESQESDILGERDPIAILHEDSIIASI